MKNTRKAITLLAACLLAACNTNAPAPAPHIYSKITDEVDKFTDDERINLYISSQGFRPFASSSSLLLFSCFRKEQEIKWDWGVHLGTMDRSASSRVKNAEVSLRFDDDPYEIVTAWYKEDVGVAIAEGSEVTNRLLEQTMPSDRLIVKVEDSNVMTFDLLAARPHLTRFVQYCEALQAGRLKYDRTKEKWEWLSR